MTEASRSPENRGSACAFEAASRVMPGGVNSPVRAFGAVGGVPRFIERGCGAILHDIDGREYIDYVGSWGPLILGHAHPSVVKAVQQAANRGTSFGAPTEAETHLATLIIERVPSIEMVRLVNSGTEAVMSAVRLARAVTGRSLIVKFDGCYHGHADALLVAAGSGAMTFGTPSSPGVTSGAAADTLVADYNDLASVESALADRGSDLAAILVEPIAGNMGLVPPVAGFLAGLREICDRTGALLIYDEVMTCFRVAPGGAQALYGQKPDITCLGKIVGGGLPLAAYGASVRIMQQVSPVGPVYQAGTLSGNPVATAAGIAMLEALDDPTIYDRLESLSARLDEGLREAARSAGVATRHARVGSMLCTFFTDSEVTNFATASACDTQQYARYFHAMLDCGIYLAPSQFECMFVSSAQTEEQIDRTVAAAREALTLTAC